MKSKLLLSNAVATVRRRFGITQSQLAAFIGCSVSKIKLAETGRRHLNSEELIKMASLELLLSANPLTKGKELSPVATGLDNRLVSKYAAEARYEDMRCTHRAMIYEKRVKKMEVVYQQVLSTLNNIETLRSVALDQHDPRLQAYMRLHSKLVRKMERCNPYAQAKLNKKIILLRAEAMVNKSLHPRNVDTNATPIFSSLKQSTMDYEVSAITNRPDCQLAIDNANEDKATLEYRKTGLERQRQNASVNVISIDADLASITAEIAALQAVYAGLPDGETKDETQVRITKAAYKKFLLDQRKANYGSLAGLSKQFDIACIDSQLEEVQAFIQALTTRYNELP